MSINWRWPSKSGNHMVPWYVISWRCLWFPVFLVGITIAAIAVSFQYGPHQALHWVRNEL